MPHTRESILQGLQRTVDGEVDAHVWKSSRFPGAILSLEFGEPGEPCDPAVRDGLVTAFGGEIEVSYEGVMAPEAANDYLNYMKQSRATE